MVRPSAQSTFRESRLPLGPLSVALLSAALMSCMSVGIETQTASRAVDADVLGLRSAAQSISRSAAQSAVWLDDSLKLSEGLDRMRQGIDGALDSSRDNAGDLVRRVRSRAIVASDACFSADEAEGCNVAAKSACVRASYADGAPLASSTYVACSGTWGLWAGDAPDGACKTKRRLNAALCW